MLIIEGCGYWSMTREELERDFENSIELNGEKGWAWEYGTVETYITKGKEQGWITEV